MTSTSTSTFDTARGWARRRGFPIGVGERRQLIAAVEPDGSRRELHLYRTAGELPLVSAQLRSPEAISAERTGEVTASLNQWNARHRLPKAWTLPRGDGTLVIALEGSLPEDLASPDAVERLLDIVVDGASAFWDWVDTTRSW